MAMFLLSSVFLAVSSASFFSSQYCLMFACRIASQVSSVMPGGIRTPLLPFGLVARSGVLVEFCIFAALVTGIFILPILPMASLSDGFRRPRGDWSLPPITRGMRSPVVVGLVVSSGVHGQKKDERTRLVLLCIVRRRWQENLVQVRIMETVVTLEICMRRLKRKITSAHPTVAHQNTRQALAFSDHYPHPP